MDTFGWSELDRLTAQLGELHRRHEAVPKGRVGLLRQIDSEILRLEDQRERLVSDLSRHVIHHIAI